MEETGMGWSFDSTKTDELAVVVEVEKERGKNDKPADEVRIVAVRKKMRNKETTKPRANGKIHLFWLLLWWWGVLKCML